MLQYFGENISISLTHEISWSVTSVKVSEPSLYPLKSIEDWDTFKFIYTSLPSVHSLGAILYLWILFSDLMN